MTGNTRQTHATKLRVLGFDSREVKAGSEIALQLEVSCSAGCDLRGEMVSIVAADGPVSTARLSIRDEHSNRTEECHLKAPGQAGELTWMVLFPQSTHDEVVHEECAEPLVFAVQPHASSLAVWDVPSPVIVGSAFRVKVGAKCEMACRLSDGLIEVRDANGTAVGNGRLNASPWLDTAALYWADVSLIAPPTEQVNSWRATLRLDPSALAHDDASAAFSFRSVPRPDHHVQVTIVEQSTGNPLQEAEVRLGMYVTSTDERGVASFAVPGGAHELTIRKDGWDCLPRTLHVQRDLATQVEATRGLTRLEWEDKLQEFKHIPWG